MFWNNGQLDMYFLSISLHHHPYAATYKVRYRWTPRQIHSCQICPWDMYSRWTAIQVVNCIDLLVIWMERLLRSDQILWRFHWHSHEFVNFITGMMNICSLFVLTHWGRVTHICVGNPIIIGSDNGLSPGRRQTIIWTNAGILLIWPLGTNFSEILIEMYTFSFKKMHLKMSSGKWRPFVSASMS